jgi:SAM-dependent MidA family methyltransferase
LESIVEPLRKRIREHGPLSFRDYMEEVLRFYYASSRNPIGTSGGDFYTSADLDPVFGQLLARQFETWARDIPSFTVVELGAGKGLLARDILRHRSFPYRILERSAVMRERQQEMLKGFDGVQWVDELPEHVTGCIFSNEFFDALPVHRVVCRGGSLKEIFVSEEFREIEAEPGRPFDVRLAEGHATEIHLDAREWIRRIAGSLERGYHLVIDYGYLRDAYLAQSKGTLMCYWRHQAVEDPYSRVGEQDITAHVNFSDLMEEDASLETVRFATQMEYLISLGILDELEKLATSGDAASLARLVKIKNLILPARMGERFKVLVQRKR